MGGQFDRLDLGLLFFQDDIFILEDDLPRLAKKIRIVDRCLQRAGLRLATNKTKIVANCHYKGCRKVKIGEDVFQIAEKDDSLKVLGVAYSLAEDASQQAKELIGRTRDALHCSFRHPVCTWLLAQQAEPPPKSRGVAILHGSQEQYIGVALIFMPSTSYRLMPVVVCLACVVLGVNSGMSGTPGHPASSEFGFTISRSNGGRHGSLHCNTHTTWPLGSQT